MPPNQKTRMARRMGKHERNIRDARKIIGRLPPYEADVVRRLCLSSEGSMRLNKQIYKEREELLQKLKNAETS